MIKHLYSYYYEYSDNLPQCYIYSFFINNYNCIKMYNYSTAAAFSELSEYSENFENELFKNFQNLLNFLNIFKLSESFEYSDNSRKFNC